MIVYLDSLLYVPKKKKKKKENLKVALVNMPS